MDPTTVTTETATNWAAIAGGVFAFAFAITQAAPSVTRFKAWNVFMWIMNRLAGNNFAARNADEPKKP